LYRGASRNPESRAGQGLEKRKPFDFPAERPFLKDGRGDAAHSERETVAEEIVIRLERWMPRCA